MEEGSRQNRGEVEGAERRRREREKLRSETFKGWWGEVGRMAEEGRGWMIATSRVEVESWAETDTTGRKKRVLREETKERRRPQAEKEKRKKLCLPSTRFEEHHRS